MLTQKNADRDKIQPLIYPLYVLLFIKNTLAALL